MLKILSLIDEYTKECLALISERNFQSRKLKNVLQGIVDERGAPTFMRSDNGTEGLARLPFLDAICHETLRMHPVVADIARQTLRPMTLGGTPVPAGAALMPAIAAVHFDACIFPDAHSFRPERFIERRLSSLRHVIA